MHANKHGFLQLFADPATDPNQGGKPGGGTDPNQQAPKTFTEEEVQARVKAEVEKARNAAAAQTRKAVEAEWKPKVQQAEEALTAAKPFLENPTQYMAQYLATNPAMIQTVADLTDRMMKGGVPTAAQVAAVSRAADAATDPKVAKRLEELENQLKAVREADAEQKTYADMLKGFGQQFKEAGLEFDRDDFQEYVNKYCDDEGLTDEDDVDVKALFRAYKAEKTAQGNRPKPPRLPGGGTPPSTPNKQLKSWADAENAAETLLRGSRD